MCSPKHIRISTSIDTPHSTDPLGWHCPTELSVMMQMFYICAAQCGTHGPISHVPTDTVLRCSKVKPKQENEDPGVFLETVSSCLPVPGMAICPLQHPKSSPIFKGSTQALYPLEGHLCPSSSLCGSCGFTDIKVYRNSKVTQKNSSWGNQGGILQGIDDINKNLKIISQL